MLHYLKRLGSTKARIRSLVIASFVALLLLIVISLSYISSGDEFNSNPRYGLSRIPLLNHATGHHMDPNNIQIDDDVYGIYSKLFTLLAHSKPSLAPITNYNKENHKIQKFPEDNIKFNKELLSSLIDLKMEDKIKLFESYEIYQSGLHNLTIDVFGSETTAPIRGDGIIMVGGGRFSWLTLLNIHQLRRTGSKLPIEVYIPTPEDYDAAFCKEILPKVNGRCVLGYEVLPLKYFHHRFQFKRFEYKILAILTSSFENVLMLDADNMVVQNPDKLFEWDVFLKNQLILWPDCWIRTTNPFLFDLLHIDVNYSAVKANVPYDIHDLPGSIPNPSTESGMLLVNKRKHVNTLLLVLYMNIYGADYYYPLLTQGGAGEGDKDSYIIAAHSLREPVYQVKQHVVFLGRYPETGFVAGGLGQCNPMNKMEDYLSKHDLPSPYCEDFMFLHLSNPKYFPNEITSNFIDEEGEHFRQFQDTRLPYDFEVQLWEIMTQLLCSKYVENKAPQAHHESLLLDPKYKLSAKSLKYIKSMKVENICQKQLLPHLQFLRSNMIETGTKRIGIKNKKTGN